MSSVPGRTRRARTSSSRSRIRARSSRVGLGAARLEHVGARRALVEVAVVGRAEPGDRGVGVRAERADELADGPDVELALDALAVGVERAEEAAVRRAHLAQRPVQRLLAGAPQQRVARRQPAVQVGARQQRVVVEHLLEVRHGPGGVDAVAREAAADLVVDAARGHRAQRLERHRRLAARQQELDRARRRELRRRSPAAVDAVERRAQRAERVVQQLRRDRIGARPQRGAAAQALRGAGRVGADLVAALLPGVGDGEQHLSPRRATVAGRRREVGPAVERRPSGVRKTFSGQPPWPVIDCTASM